jgi:predicted N-acyltransferase
LLKSIKLAGNLGMQSTSELRMQVVSSVSQIDQEAWESLQAPDNLFTTLDYLKAVEESHALECEFQYFQFYKDGEMICGLAGYQLQLDLSAYAGRLLANMLSPIQRIFTRFLSISTLIIGTPVSAGLTAVFRSGINSEQLSNVVEHLMHYVRQQKIRVVLVRDFKQKRSLLEQVLEMAGFQQVENFPLAYMPIPWNNFEDYLAAMKSRYRYDARRRIKHKSAQDIETRFCNNSKVMQYTQQYVMLYQNVLAQSNEFPHEIIGADYHQSMRRNLGKHSYWLQHFQGDQLVAFLHFILYRKRIIAQYIGLDYQVSEAGQLYFNAFYDLIRFAIQQGATQIEAGISSYPAKSSMGFSVLPMRMYIWHRSKLVRLLIAKVFSALSHSDLDKCHIIFKDPSQQSF